MSPYRVGLVGMGWMNRRVWAPRFAAHPRFDVVGAVDPAHPGTVDGVEVLPSLDDLLDRRLDVAVVAVPNRLHATLARAVLAAGADVFVEKPVCLSRTELDEVVAAAERSGRRVVASRAARHRRDVRALLAHVPAARPLSVRACWRRAAGVPGPGTWFTDRSAAGGGALLDLGWHLADVGLLALGFRPPVSVECAIGPAPEVGDAAAWHSGSGDAPVDVEVAGTAVAEFEGGDRLEVHASWAADVPVDTTTLVVEGDGASAELTTTFGFSPNRHRVPSLVVRREHGEDRVGLAAPAVGAEYDAEVDALAGALAGGGDWRTEIDQTAALVAFFESAYHAARRPLRR